MKCHYEILEVPRDAKVEDIKKARDRLAKKFHPDKAHQANDPSLVAEYTATFRLIQQAYEVLSDNHERAWYDGHREQILAGGTAVQEDIEIFSFFNTSCYSGFGDDENGFFAVYQKIFTKISSEDVRKAKDAYEEYEVPEFGNSSSSYEEVVNPFYGFWQSYSTKRTFFSLDKWDLREADNRRTSRAMEKENKKVRDSAKKEWNESVRELANFVRKRDPRVKAYRVLLEQKAEENRLKVKQIQEEQRRQRQELISSHVDHSDRAELEKKYRDLEKSFKNGAISDQSDDGEEDETEVIEEEEEEEEDPLYCLICEKRFKSFPAMRNHIQSKQHKKNAEILRAELVEEEDLESVEDDMAELNLVETEDTKESEESRDTKESKETTESSPTKETKETNETHESVSEISESKTKKANKNGVSDKEIQRIKRPESPVEKAESVEEESVVLADAPAEIVVEEYKSRNKSKKEKKTKQTQEKVQELGLRCAVCKKLFPSRTKLFQHIKDENHAVLK